MKKSFVIVLAGALLHASALAEIVRWVDERGVVHYSDKAPPKTRAQTVEVDKRLPPEKSGREIEARLKGDRDYLRSSPGGTAADRLAGAIQPAPRPVSQPNGDSCEAQWERYSAAQACFSDFRNANGSVGPGAYRQCPVLAEPDFCRNFNVTN